MKRILLLEDDLSLGETIKELLLENDYEVDYVTKGNDVIEITFDKEYDLYIFDINVPDIDGLEILKSLRDADDSTPAIFISAMTDLNTFLKGFEVGADDFIKKPFYPEELIVKVNLKLSSNKKEIAFNDIVYLPKNKQLFKNNENIYLTQIQLNLFELFINNKNRIIAQEELYDCLEKPTGNGMTPS
ncbi:response regulator transcription factor [Aliarcobacter butzleri]|uniref:response regulator transcription factor n=1 Tax=Aliarcobacter butzleri TaxID=28197 RepID=UPI001EDB3A31|nr:response regulator transcription factor [Aliarcobacter butzleri]MCG3707315.1 response regulator transcription factor [Aliarcobacter butzleri]